MRTLVLTAALTVLLGAPAKADDGQPPPAAERQWASFAAMTDPSSGLPADALNADGTTSVETSTTNIGAYMWSAVVARRLHLISQRELVARLSRTLGTLGRMERYGDTGQFYNWYDHHTGKKL